MRTAPGTDPVVLHGLKIDFLASVTRPAHDEAKALLLKRRDTGKAKPSFLKPDDDDEDEKKAKAKAKAKLKPGAKKDNGTNAATYTVTTNGLGEVVNWIPIVTQTTTTGSLPEDDMSEPTTKTDEQVQEIEDQLDIARLFASFDDAQRAHFESLSEAKKVTFAKKSPEDRAAVIAKAAESTEVLYKDADGHEYTKADGIKAIASARRADALAAKVEKMESDASQVELEKRADSELGHLPGSSRTRAVLLKAAEDIEDETEREEALAALKAGNEAISKSFDEFGSGEGVSTDESSAGGRLEKAVQKYATDNSVTEAKAYQEFLKTPEGKALYTESLQ